MNGSVPFKVQLKKLFEGPSVYLDRSAKSRHVFVQVNDTGYFSEEPVRYQPRLTKVLLTNDEDVLIAKVFEDVGGQEKACLSDNILYTFYRNQKLVGQNGLGYLNLSENGIEADGLFKVVVSVMENGVIVSEMEGQPLYLDA